VDPNATLKELRDLVSDAIDRDERLNTEDTYRLAELVRALDGWLTKGGFLPQAWEDMRPLVRS